MKIIFASALSPCVFPTCRKIHFHPRAPRVSLSVGKGKQQQFIIAKVEEGEKRGGREAVVVVWEKMASGH